MRFGKTTLLLAAAAASLIGVAPHAARAGSMAMSFDQFQDGESILSGYDGGIGSAGSSGPNLGINFTSPAAIAFGASGGFSNNPSPPNALGFNGSGPFTMSLVNGFAGSLTFSYASESCLLATIFGQTCGDASIAVLDNHGNTLASLDLPDNFDASDSSLDVFTTATLAFAGDAASVQFSNVTDFFGGASAYFDDVTLVPEPGSLSLLFASLGAVGFLRRRAKR